MDERASERANEREGEWIVADLDDPFALFV